MDSEAVEKAACSASRFEEPLHSVEKSQVVSGTRTSAASKD